MNLRHLRLAALALAPIAFVQDSAPSLPMPVPCKLDAWIECPGGKIEFKIDVVAPTKKIATPTFTLLNGAYGEDKTWIERWDKTPESVKLDVNSYDSHLELMDVPIQGELRGTWRKLRGPGDWLEMPLRARVGSAASATPAASTATPPPIAGRWAVKFAAAEDPAVGVFRHPAQDTIAGTFMTTLGDYRFLTGKFDHEKERWTLSCFDGAHAFLFTAAPQPDGTLAGEFWSGDKWHDTWTAKKDDKAALPDPFKLTKPEGQVDWSKLLFTTVDRAKVTLDDPKFAGKARIVQLFGTWCPNCNDEAEYLHGLEQIYKKQGLSIVGLAFELGGDEARDLEQLKRFAERHKLEYPLLLAGKADKAEALKAIPVLDKLRAYPTTLFLHADGRIRAVHQGYCGPATGQDHMKLRQDFERIIGELLKEPSPAGR